MWMQCENGRNGSARCSSAGKSPYFPFVEFERSSVCCALFELESRTIPTFCSFNDATFEFMQDAAGIDPFYHGLHAVYSLHNPKSESQLQINNLWNYFPIEILRESKERTVLGCEAITKNIFCAKKPRFENMQKKRVRRKNFDYATVAARSQPTIYIQINIEASPRWAEPKTKTGLFNCLCQRWCLPD